MTVPHYHSIGRTQPCFSLIIRLATLSRGNKETIEGGIWSLGPAQSALLQPDQMLRNGYLWPDRAPL